jgi:putative ABC transport system permease protein
MLVAQISLSLVLLVTTGLLIRALHEAGKIDPGFDATRVEIVQLDLSLAGYDENRGLAFADHLLERVRAVSGIESACLAVDLPLDGGGYGFGRLIAPGVDMPDEEGVGADWNLVTSDFFRTMGITLLEGRAFTESDRAGARRVAIVNQTLAHQLWPGESAVGKRLLNPQPEETFELEVVGVEKDLKYRTLGEAPRRFIYVPYPQRYFERVHLLVRHTPGANVLPALRALVTELDPNLPVVNMSSLTEYTSIGLLPQRLAVTVAGSLGLVGLALVVLGVYGVVAYSVSRRARELGVRIALGAAPQEVLYLVLRQGARLGALGVLFGALLALATTRAFAGLLYGITAADPLTYGAAGMLLIGAVIAASLPPARRAASIDPVAALREE